MNWENVASAMGLKNKEVAKVRFGQIKKRLGWSAPASKDAKDTTSAGAEPSKGNGKIANKVTKPRAKTGGKASKAKEVKAKPEHSPDTNTNENANGHIKNEFPVYNLTPDSLDSTQNQSLATNGHDSNEKMNPDGMSDDAAGHASEHHQLDYYDPANRVKANHLHLQSQQALQIKDEPGNEEDAMGEEENLVVSEDELA